MKKISMALVCLLACLLLLTGCMNSNNRTLGTTAQPSADPFGDMDLTPGTSDRADSTGQPAANSTATHFDWLTGRTQVEDKINQLSEIEKSTVVVMENTALVGVTFTSSYAGELTQRIHDMVAAQVQQADAAIQTVAVTAEEEDVKKIEEISSKVQSGTPVGDLEQEIDSIVRNVTTMS